MPVLKALMGDGKLRAHRITNGVETKELTKSMFATLDILKYLCSVLEWLRLCKIALWVETRGDKIRSGTQEYLGITLEVKYLG